MMASEAAVVASEPKSGMRGYITAHPLVLLLPFFTAVILLRFDPNMGYAWDDSVYALLTHAFSHGLGNVLVNDPNMARETLLPIGLPVILTPVALIWESPLAYKFALVGIYLFGTLITYRFFSTNFGARVGLFVTLAYAVNVYITVSAYQLAAETPYIPLSILACAALLRYQRAGRVVGWELLLAAVALNALIYTRSVGLTLLIAGALWLLLQGSWRKAMALPLTALLISLPLQLGWLLGGPESWSAGYAGYLHFTDPAIITLIANNIGGYALNLVRLVVQLPFEVLYNSDLTLPTVVSLILRLLLLVVPLGLIGWGMLRERTPVGQLLVLYVVVFMGILLIWPFSPEPRFIVPILPILLFFLVRGLNEATRALPPQVVSASMLGLLLLVVGSSMVQHINDGLAEGSNLVTNVALYELPARYPPERSSYIIAGWWLEARSRVDAVVLCGDPYDFYLWTGRRTLGYYSTADTERLLSNSDYLVANSFADGSATPIARYAATHPNRLQLIYTAEGPAPAFVYRVIKLVGAIVSRATPDNTSA